MQVPFCAQQTASMNKMIEQILFHIPFPVVVKSLELYCKNGWQLLDTQSLHRVNLSSTKVPTSEMNGKIPEFNSTNNGKSWLGGATVMPNLR